LAKIIDIKAEGDAKRFTLEVPTELENYIARKGSIALNGTSLTINAVNDNTFDVLIIRHTLQVTTWGFAALNDNVNLEVDQLARYAARWYEKLQK